MEGEYKKKQEPLTRNMADIDKLDEKLDRILKSAVALSKSKSFDVFQILDTVEHNGATKMQVSTGRTDSSSPKAEIDKVIKMINSCLKLQHHKINNKVQSLEARKSAIVNMLHKEKNVVGKFECS